MLEGDSSHVEDVAFHLLSPSTQVVLVDDVLQLTVVFVVLTEVDNLADVGLQEEEEDCDVVLLLLWAKGESQSAYDVYLMIEYGTHSIEKILILSVIREANFECFFDSIDKLLEIDLIFVQLIDIMLDHEDYLIDDVHDQL